MSDSGSPSVPLSASANAFLDRIGTERGSEPGISEWLVTILERFAPMAELLAKGLVCWSAGRTGGHRQDGDCGGARASHRAWHGASAAYRRAVGVIAADALARLCAQMLFGADERVVTMDRS